MVRGTPDTSANAWCIMGKKSELEAIARANFDRKKYVAGMSEKNWQSSKRQRTQEEETLDLSSDDEVTYLDSDIEIISSDSNDDDEEQLEEKLKQIENIAKKDNGNFVEVLFKTYPPIHQPVGKQVNLHSKIKRKILLRKLTPLYHPDKIDRAKHGEKYFSLCEKITAKLNVMYSNYK